MRRDIEWITTKKTTNINEIRTFEEICRYNFPKNYIDLMLHYNGADIDNYIYCFIIYFESGEKVNNIFGGCVFLAYGSDESVDETSLIHYVWKNKDNDINYPFPNHLVPIAYDGGGNYVCFDYRHDPKTDNPKVVFWFHEEAGCLDDGLEVYFIANSFDEFLDSLFDRRDEKEKAEDAKSKKEYLEKYGAK